MRFSSLLKALQTGDAGLLWSNPGADPQLKGAASLELAAADQLSFLEKPTLFIQSLGKTVRVLFCSLINRT